MPTTTPAKTNPAMDFLTSSLRSNPKAAYADLKAKADEKKLTIYPIMFGRAQTLLGIVKAAKRGQGKAAARIKAAAAPKSGGASKSDRIRELLSTGMSPGDIAKKVGSTTALVYTLRSKGGAAKRGRPRTPAAPAGLDGILDAVRNGERERTKLRGALEKIQALLVSALS